MSSLPPPPVVQILKQGAIWPPPGHSHWGDVRWEKQLILDILEHFSRYLHWQMAWKHLWLIAQCEWNLTAQSHGQRWENAAINTDPTEIWRCVIKASENVLLSRQRTWDWFFSQVRFFVKYWPDWHLFFVQYHDQTWWRLFIMYYIFHKLSSS